ncbi:MAG TPA: ATP-binding protein [Edaphocola sp.]|nr:ATP-binding protein [Edaphocola sp.]
MIELLDKEMLTEEDIKQLISLKVEESIHLDFKQSDSLGKNDKKKLELAKDVSAFANSAGGFIVYGLIENNHVADSLSFIDGDEITKEWIEQVIQTRIQRKIEGLKITPVRINNDLQKSIYIIKIPESSLAPHMTSDKRFYKRYNFESVQMEEYEIRNLYNRKEKTNLVIHNIITSTKLDKENEGDIDETVFYFLAFQIENIGKAIEKYFKLTIQLNFTEYTIKWTGLKETKLNHSVLFDNERIISLSNSSPIFPDEVLTIGELSLGIKSLELGDVLKRAKLKLKLYYTNGIDEMEIDLKHILKKTNT